MLFKLSPFPRPPIALQAAVLVVLAHERGLFVRYLRLKWLRLLANWLLAALISIPESLGASTRGGRLSRTASFTLSTDFSPREG